MYIFNLGEILLQLNISSKVIINKNYFWREIVARTIAPSLLARLGTATALSNGKVKSRAPPRSLPKRLGPLWATVTVMGDHNIPRRRSCATTATSG